MLNSRFQPSRRMAQVQTPVIPVIAELIAQNPGTISLGQGVVYYGPPPSAFKSLSALDTSMENNRYGLTGGMPALVDIIAEKIERENRIRPDKGSRIIVTAGANMGFLNTLFAITDPGDEIILSLPYYFNHEMAISMLNCRPVLVSTDDDYQPCPDQIRRKISGRTRAIVTVSPNNPCGAVYPESLLREINTICAENGIYHISDEAYEYFTYNGARHFSPGGIKGSNEYTISLYSLSKAYGFAAWRIGYMVIPDHLAGAVTKAQDTNLICPPVASQYAAVAALTSGQGYCREKLGVIGEVRKIVLDELYSIREICSVPQSNGALYLFLKVNTSMDDTALVERLIREHRVAVIPGNTFGMTDGCYLRVAFGALNRETAQEGIRRLTHGLKSIIG